jgi:hypothetical protein
VAVDVGGDHADDLVSADAATGIASVQITPGDRALDLGHGAMNVSAGDGYVIWSRVRADGQFGLAQWHAGSISDLNAITSHMPIIARIGRGSNGDPVVSYGRCATGCAAYSYDLRNRTQHRLPIRLAAACLVKSVQQWARSYDYWLRSRAGRTCRRAGGWVSWPGERPRRLGGPNIHYVGDVRANRAGWIDEQQFRNGEYRVRALVLDRRGLTRVVANGGVCDIDCSGGLGGEGPIFDGRDSYAIFSYAQDTVELDRTRSTSGRRCTTYWDAFDFGTTGIPSQGIGGSADVAVAAGRIYYAEPRGLFAVDPSRVRLRHRHCERSR